MRYCIGAVIVFLMVFYMVALMVLGKIKHKNGEEEGYEYKITVVYKKDS